MLRCKMVLPLKCVQLVHNLSHILQKSIFEKKKYVVYIAITWSSFIKADIMGRLLHSVILRVCEETSVISHASAERFACHDAVSCQP